MSNFLSNLMRTAASNLETPVIVVLGILLGASVVLFGSLVVEFFTERRKLKVNMPKLADDIRKGTAPIQKTVYKSGLLKRQKEALLELTKHPDLTDNMNEALATRLLDAERNRYGKIVKISDLVAKLGPTFGLLGTLIPLGPGLIALGQKDTLTLSESLLTAFDTTIIGLIAAAIAMVVSIVRKSWYSEYMSMLEASMEWILEGENVKE